LSPMHHSYLSRARAARLCDAVQRQLCWRAWVAATMFFARLIPSAFFAAALVLSVALISKPAAAAFALRTESSHEWHWYDERVLHALVVAREGRERLSLEIQVPDQMDLTVADELVWAVPIPALATAIHAREILGFPALNGFSVVGEWLDRTDSMLTAMAGSQIWPCPLLIATGWAGGAIAKPPWQAPVLSHPLKLRGDTAVEIGPWTSDAALAASTLGARGIVMSAPAAAALTLTEAPVQSIVLLRFSAPAQLARAIQASDDAPVFGLEIEFPSVPSFVPIAPALNRNQPRSIHVIADGFVKRLGAQASVVHCDHLLGWLGNASSPPVAGRYTAFWTTATTTGADAQQWLIPGASRLTEMLAAWSTSSLRDPLDIALGLIVFLVISGAASLAAHSIYPLPGTSRRQALLLGLANLLTFAGTLVVLIRYAKKRRISVSRGSLFACLSSLTFTIAVGLLAALTTLLRP
jgi:hypothetical protein